MDRSIRPVRHRRDDVDVLLQPRRLYERQGRLDEYEATVPEMRADRRAYLRSFPGLDEGIVEVIYPGG